MKNIKSKSVQGIYWDLLGTVSNQGISFVISIFLARLLLPEEFGVVGMALVFISLSRVFTDFGFTQALIQNKENTSVTYSSIFYINFAAGLVLFSLAQIFADAVGDFYNNQEVEGILRWLSLTFVLNSLNMVQTTILKREIDFKTLTTRHVLAHSIGGIVGIVMAFNDFGAYSLVAQNLVSSGASTVFLWTVTSWYPKFEYSKEEVKKLSGFTVYMFFDKLFSNVFRRLDVFFIGKVFSAEALGYYTRAESMNTLVTQYSSKTITKVFFPVLSKFQDDQKGYENVYEKVIGVIGIIAFGLTGIFYVLGDFLIILLFGEKWQPSVIIFQLLILKAFSYPLNSMIVNAFLAKGQAKENFWIGIARKLLRLIPFFIGYFYGLLPFIIAMVGTSYFISLMNMFLLQKYIGVSFSMHLKKMGSGLIPLIILVLTHYMLDEKTFLLEIGLVIIFVPFYLLFNYLTNKDSLVFLGANLKELFLKLRKRIKKG